MKKFLLCFFLIFGVFADQTILVDPYFSPYTGANDLLFGEWALTKTVDAFTREKKSDGTLAVCGRTLEQLGWAELGIVACIIQHEVFGHGYRLRQLGVTPKKYEIRAAEGATYFKVKDHFPVGELQAVTVAGLEAEQILALTAKMNWLQKGSIDGRLGITYFQAQQSLFFYTLITHLGRLHGDSLSGNDIQSYLFLLHQTYPNSSMSRKQLMTWATFNWLDPMTFYSLFSWFYYIAEKQSFTIPILSKRRQAQHRNWQCI